MSKTEAVRREELLSLDVILLFFVLADGVQKALSTRTLDSRSETFCRVLNNHMQDIV